MAKTEELYQIMAILFINNIQFYYRSHRHQWLFLLENMMKPIIHLFGWMLVREKTCSALVNLKYFAVFLVSYYNSQIRMSRHSSSQKHRYKSPTFSPDNAYTSYYNISEVDPEIRLSEKIHKLKYALKGAQQHNQQLHSKVNYFKDLYNHDVVQIKEQLKKYKKKYANLQQLYDKKLQQLEKSKQKTRYEERQAISASKDKTNQIKELQAKIIQLQTLNFQLNSKLNEKTQKIKKLETQIDTIREDQSYELTRKLTKLEKELIAKNKECLEFQKQITSLKDLLRQAQRKVEKANLAIFEQAQRNKHTVDQHKEAKKGVLFFQKQLANQRQTGQRQKNELKQKIRVLEKSILEHEFNQQRTTEKLNEEAQKNQKLQNQMEQMFTSYNELQLKYDDILSSQYQSQKDFERDLTIIAKQIARRHIAAKSPKTSTAPSVQSANLRKRQFPHLING